MDKPETDSVVPSQNPTELATPPPEAPPAIQFETDEAKTPADYANFCRLSGTPEELLIDFGLNPQPMGGNTQPIEVTQRVVTSWHTAKRLLHVLQLTIQRHEAAFGALETDVQKRVSRQ